MMKSLIAVAAIAAATGYTFAGSSTSSLASAFDQLKTLTLIGMAEREKICSKAADEGACRAGFNALIETTFAAEAWIFDALHAENAGDPDRREEIVIRMQKATIDGRAELERLRSLHVP